MSPTYVALDLETTGLDGARDSIIEIGAVKFDSRHELGRFSSLVNPGRPIPLQISKLTGITDRDVVTAPRFPALREKLSRFVDGAVIVGHNVVFDLEFLHRQDCLKQNAHIDTFALSTILMPHEKRYSLDKLAGSLGIPLIHRHRALDDAIATMHLWLALQKRAIELPLKTLEIINRAARKSSWPPRWVFQEAERVQAREVVESTIGAQLRAKGLVGAKSFLVGPPQMEPLIPVDKRTALDVDQLVAMLENGGALEGVLPGFEYREPQVEMLRAVAGAFNASRHLIVEAGTGIGKSIAYLLPAMHWAVRNGERVVVSTNTINLQDQLCDKDIPDLRDLLPFEVRTTVLKGRTNYVCVRRLEALQNREDLTGDQLNVLSKVLIWLPNTATGDRAELFLHGTREMEAWSQVSSDADACTADHCRHNRRGECFFYRARRAAENAHIVIVNHALLLSDVATENRVLPQYNYLIVDEAHHLESAATHQLGYTVTRWGIEALLTQLAGHPGQFEGFGGRALAHCERRVPDDLINDLRDAVSLLQEHCAQVRRGVQELFEDLAAFVAEQRGNRGSYDFRVRVTRGLRAQSQWEQIELAWDGLSENIQTTVEGLARVLGVLRGIEGFKVPGHDDVAQDGAVLARQLTAVHQQMGSVLADPKANEIVWLQSRANTNEILLCAVPLRVERLVEQHLLWPKEAVIFTSATLRTSGDFSFIKERLGAADAEEVALGSPFDYESQVMLYLPTDIPEPSQPYHQKMVNQTLADLVAATQGRTLVLFTSYSQLREVHNAISRPLAEKGITVYAQGLGASRSQLLENFRTTRKSVLLGTRSFWEGIDVPGEALSCLVMTKLPFAVPSDPVFAARSEELDDPFLQYAVPDAILRFRQGFGRLIRTKADRGVVVILDKRLQSKPYGALFVSSLPPCTTVRGSLTELPIKAAAWIKDGPVEAAGPAAVLEDDGELEYVSFDDL